MTQNDVRKTLANWPDTLVDEASFRREQAKLARVWTLVGHMSDLRHDGDWFRATLASRSVFVQRFGNELKGFENRCAHRSFPLRTSDRGNGPIVCGFHSWRYDKEGRAIGIPQCQPLFGKPVKAMGAGLEPIDIATCGSLVFGRFRSTGDDAGADQSLEEFLGESFPIIAAMWSSPATPEFIKSDVAANWRLCFQIAVEDYHVVAVHAPVWGKHGYLKREDIAYFRFGPHSAFFTHPDPDGLTRMADECRQGIWRSANYRVFHIFPNLTVNHFRADSGYWYVMAMQYVPVSASRSVMRAWYRPAPFPSNRPWHDRWSRFFTAPVRHLMLRYYTRKVLGQDSSVCEHLQTIARQVDPSPMLGGLEERLGWFEDIYAAHAGTENRNE